MLVRNFLNELRPNLLYESCCIREIQYSQKCRMFLFQWRRGTYAVRSVQMWTTRTVRSPEFPPVKVPRNLTKCAYLVIQEDALIAEELLRRWACLRYYTFAVSLSSQNCRGFAVCCGKHCEKAAQRVRKTGRALTMRSPTETGISPEPRYSSHRREEHIKKPRNCKEPLRTMIVT